MKKDKRKIDKEYFKGLLIVVLGVIAVVGIASTFLFHVLFSILEFQLSLAIKIVFGLLCGGTCGVVTAISNINNLDGNDYEEDIEYEEYEREKER